MNKGSGRLVLRGTIILMLLVGALILGQQRMTKSYAEGMTGDRFVPGHVIVFVKSEYLQTEQFTMGKGPASYENRGLYADLMPGIDIQSAEELMSVDGQEGRRNTNETEAIYSGRMVLLELQKKGEQDVLDAIELLKQNPAVEFAEPDYYMQPCSTYPNDPLFTNQHSLSKISAPQAWDITTGSYTVKIGIMDDGVDINHPDLVNNIWRNEAEINGIAGVDDDLNGYIDDTYGYDVNGIGVSVDETGHGTVCASMAGAVGNNGIGISGVAWNVAIVPIKVYSLNLKGITTSTTVRGIKYADDTGIEILSISYGKYYGDAAEYIAVSNSKALIVAGAGNDSKQDCLYPATWSCDNIISVASTDMNDNLSSFSNYSSALVDLAAPGDQLLCCEKGGGYKTISGTSLSTPIVAGAAALLKAYDPSLTTAELKTALLRGVDIIPSLSDKTLTGGRLNIYKSLTYVKKKGQFIPHFYNQVIAPESNMLYPNFKLYYQGEPVDLKDVTIRYYYTREGQTDQNFWCDYSGVNGFNGAYRNITSSINGSIVTMPKTAPRANHYLDITFKPGAGILLPGDCLEVKCRIAKKDWSNYNQSNDRHFNKTATNYEYSDKICIYYKGMLMTGDDPTKTY